MIDEFGVQMGAAEEVHQPVHPCVDGVGVIGRLAADGAAGEDRPLSLVRGSRERVEVVERGALGAGQLPGADCRGQAGEAQQAADDHHDGPEALVQGESGAVDAADAVFARGLRQTSRAVEPVGVGDRQGLDAEAGGLGDQLLHMVGTEEPARSPRISSPGPAEGQ
ncbi:hypothetical protein GCM10009535_45900 [Streptomyces thermocarboxydovorans]|uniref:Uncharacterized protein n=1 Tax=Streptomyces thermocarboxydovorans TaxID=59298 RepID=A0ABN1HP28_9ACTN